MANTGTGSFRLPVKQLSLVFLFLVALVAGGILLIQHQVSALPDVELTNLDGQPASLAAIADCLLYTSDAADE